MGTITFNGVSSASFTPKIQVETFPSWTFPGKRINENSVPGRNGDVILDTNAYDNVSREYTLSCGAHGANYTQLALNISKWLHSATGYARLEDSYEPGYFRLAYYKDEGTITNILNQAGKIDVTFVCKPQRFLNSGTTVQAITAGATLTNSTGYTALPIITIRPTGGQQAYVKISNSSGDYYVHINMTGLTTTPITIDCSNQDCYYGATNYNSKVTLTSDSAKAVLTDKFPVLAPGLNTFTFSNCTAFTDTSSQHMAKVTPNWYVL